MKKKIPPEAAWVSGGIVFCMCSILFGRMRNALALQAFFLTNHSNAPPFRLQMMVRSFTASLMES